MTDKKRAQVKADLALLSMAFCWGLSYHAVEVCVGETGVAGLTGMRFLLSFVITALIFWKKLKGITGKTLFYGFLLGVFNAGCYQAATLSIKYTISTNAAFLCTLSLVTVPIIEFVLFRKKLPSRAALSIAIAFIGVVFLTMGTGFRFGSENAFGDICGLMSSFFYALEIVYTDRAVRTHELDPVQLGICSIGSTGIIMTVISIAINDISLPHSSTAMIAVLFLAIFCSAYPFIVQPIAQKYTETTHVGIIITLEPVFASIFAAFFEGLYPGGLQLAGEVLMLAAMIILEVDIPVRTKSDS